ncbi:FHA domain-containing protein [Flavimaricola marinus]|uniref:FHA domain-containing protein n=1 Tax=Flavimaricola marinus TaxID=1819565 RepID=A0A238LCK3_9RHOB|nr:FHA domain-containing protein [Flavimaricola marinus]SMY07293.1 hypothetical protein LOM8899_01426 [Flavimaricola marinus]
MTMFRRVFSNHLEEQGKELRTSQPLKVDHDLPPAPPKSPPEFKTHGKSPMQELVQRRPTGAVMELGGEEPHAAADEDLAARAAEIHEQMLRRTKPNIALPAPEPSDPDGPNVEPMPMTVPPKRSGRARTRLLGFDSGNELSSDPIEKAEQSANSDGGLKPTGWIAITDGPGVGRHFPVFNGVAMIGRGEDQTIRLDFGDQTISRKNHAALAYDAEDNKFYIGHGGKSNIIKLNGRPVLSTEEMFHGDCLRIGQTTLRFVALCGEGFQWGSSSDA